MLDDIKTILGIVNSEAFDDILSMYIATAKADLQSAGIISSKIVETDALIYSAIVSFVLSMCDTYEYREMSANCYALQKDQLRHYTEYIIPAEV